MHAHDRLIKPDQKRVTTVCGLRVAVGRSVIITEREHLFLKHAEHAEGRAKPPYDCVGCLAVIELRGRDIDDPLSDCQNCGKRWRESELREIQDIHQRVNPGEPMPSGECPECGALCQQLDAIPRRARVKLADRPHPADDAWWCVCGKRWDDPIHTNRDRPDPPRK